MPEPTLENRLTSLLAQMNEAGGYPLSLVCTEQGLLVAAVGEHERTEVAAGLTALFDDIVHRATRDLEMTRVDEFTVVDDTGLRYVVRPLPQPGTTRLFLVVAVPRRRTWRRHTNRLVSAIEKLMRPLVNDGRAA